MIKSRNLLIALVALIITTLAILGTDIHPSENALLQNYSATARHWSTMNYYSNNQGGYQASAAAWTREAFH